MSDSKLNAQRGRMRLLLVLLYLAIAIMIGRAAVTQNAPAWSMESYTRGELQLPFQGRYLMVWVMRWASASPLMGKLAGMLRNSTNGPLELAIQGVDSLCMIALGWVVLKLRKEFQPRPMFDWLAPVLMLWVVAFTYVVRYEQRIFLPYDFLSILFFNLGLLAVLQWRMWSFFLIMLIGSYNRETLLFLIPIWGVLYWRTEQRVKALAIMAAGLAIWGAVRFHVHLLTHKAPASAGLYINWGWNLASLYLPHHWAQVLSVGGYLVIPMWLRRDLIKDRKLALLWLGCVPFLLADLVFGVWDETRIFGELSLLIAVTAACQFEQMLSERTAENDLPVLAGEKSEG